VPDLAASPVRQARQAIHKTIAEASEAAGVNWQTWFLVEQGCYEDIPGRMIDYLGRVNVVVEEYYEYRRNKQRAFGERYHLSEFSLPPVDITCSPIYSLRMVFGISRADFAKSFAVQVAHLYNCEKGRARFIPSAVREAFRTGGLPVEKVDELDDRQEEFYEWHKNSQNVK